MIEYIFDNKEKPIIQNNIINIEPKSYGPSFEKNYKLVEPKDLTNLKKNKTVKFVIEHKKCNEIKINGIKVFKKDGKFEKEVHIQKEKEILIEGKFNKKYKEIVRIPVN